MRTEHEKELAQELEVVCAQPIIVIGLWKARLGVDAAEELGSVEPRAANSAERRVRGRDGFPEHGFEVREGDMALGDESPKILDRQPGLDERVGDSIRWTSIGRNLSASLGCTTPTSTSRFRRSRPTPARSASSAPVSLSV